MRLNRAGAAGVPNARAAGRSRQAAMRERDFARTGAPDAMSR